MEKLDLKKIIQVNFPEDQYYKSQYDKIQIVLHHTVSPPNNSASDIEHWKSTPDRISTCVIIQGDGNIFQCFSSKYWGYHLGVQEETFEKYNIPYRNLNKTSIGIEIDSWGGLIQHTDRKWYPCIWNKFTRKNEPYLKAGAIKNPFIMDKPYRGFFAFQKYTSEQIDSVRKLLVYWNEFYKIPLKYNEFMWDINIDALKGKPGVWSHTSFRKDKSDCYPDPELISMLKSL